MNRRKEDTQLHLHNISYLIDQLHILFYIQLLIYLILSLLALFCFPDPIFILREAQYRNNRLNILLPYPQSLYQFLTAPITNYQNKSGLKQQNFSLALLDASIYSPGGSWREQGREGGPSPLPTAYLSVQVDGEL